ncbi:IS66-like element accessory protein TnpA [Castellaniella sp.]|uniref:IS66-like element accessory protein TnpA n=1 Tax=Castellaniella sp. TaxID=1955812 RepID=UPI002B0037FF|nr:transposase [Castellaniella sp.]
MPQEITLDRAPRRTYTPEFRAQVVQQCQQPGASTSAIALSYGLNANMVRRWCSKARSHQTKTELTVGNAFIALDIAAAQQHHCPGGGIATTIEVQLQRGQTQARVQWPSHASRDCATWLRDLFR